MDIVVASSEVAPFSKTGGMGDVTGSLAAALAGAGHRVMTVSPRYRAIDPGLAAVGHRVHTVVGRWGHEVGLRCVQDGGVTHVLVEHAVYDRDGIYGDGNGSFGDNHIRYALLCKVAIEAARRVPMQGGTVGQGVVFHCHDWQTALVPLYLEALYRPLGLLQGASSVLTLHNPAHQGRLPASLFPDLELAPRWFEPWALAHNGDLGLLRGGILHADQLTTVSPTFAWEATTEAGGFGLDGLLRQRAADFTGIVNGVDTETWDPTSDPHIAAPYDAADPGGKAVCKAALQQELGLPVAPRTPLVGSVGRLDPQKGIELLIDSIPWLVGQGAQVVVLGSAAGAHAHYERQLRDLEHAYPQAVRSWIGFSEPVAHRIHAGADLFAMPSLFEPCGLTQLHGMRYGTVPVVRRTGGLADTVDDFDAGSDTGTGFAFSRPAGHALREALWRALVLYRSEPEAFARLQARGMAQDLGWAGRVPEYEAVYRRASSGRT